MIWENARASLANQRGSIAPLGLGLFIFSIAFCLTTVSATSVFLFQKRLTTLAESVAIFVANGQGDSTDFMNLIGSPPLGGVRVVNALAPDDATVVVTACALWRAPIITVDVFAKSEVCSRASARLGN